MPDRIDLLPGEQFQELRDTGRREPFQLHTAHRLLLAPKVGQQLREMVVAADVRVAERADDEQAGFVGLGDEVPEQAERRAVRPVQVVEDQHDRRLPVTC